MEFIVIVGFIVCLLFVLTVLIGFWRIQNALAELVDLSHQALKTQSEMSALVRELSTRQAASGALPGPTAAI